MSPLFYDLTRMRLRASLRRQGYQRSEINHMLDGVTDAVIDGAVRDAGAKDAVGAIGDGSILQAILDFLASPLGQQLIQTLVSILIAGL